MEHNMDSTTPQQPNEKAPKRPAINPLPFLPNDDVPYLVRGYPKIGGHMTRWPEQAIFRRFNELNARNMLYMQAEPCELDLELRIVEMYDKQDGLEFVADYKKLEASHGADAKEARQIQLV
jgi:hypothetical protein